MNHKSCDQSCNQTFEDSIISTNPTDHQVCFIPADHRAQQDARYPTNVQSKKRHFGKQVSKKVPT